jgi:monoamine oxidase
MIAWLATTISSARPHHPRMGASRWPALTLALSVAVAACGTVHKPKTGAMAHRQAIRCDVAIVGGGMAGVHSAYRLGEAKAGKVCLFEASSRLGGRVYDRALKEGGATIGVGARRFIANQPVLVDLAKNLSITWDAVPKPHTLVVARGANNWDARRQEFSNDLLARRAFPKLAAAYDTTSEPDDVENALLARIRGLPGDDDGRSLRAWTLERIGPDGLEFMEATWGFRGDFQYPLSARAYLDWLTADYALETTKLYPVGGMSQFVERMAGQARADGVEVFLSEPVLRVDSEDGAFRLETPQHTVRAQRVILAVNPTALPAIAGDVVAEIVSNPHFQALRAVKVVTITQLWPEPWWESPAYGSVAGGAREIYSDTGCITRLEIPSDSAAVGQYVTRTVYSDDMRCVTYWSQLAAISEAAVDAHVVAGLRALLPGVAIPTPTRTVVQVWNDGWYWLGEGASVTNADVAEWALQPVPGKAVSLAGDGYCPQRSSWSDGALKSSLRTLNANFGMNLPIQGAEVAEDQCDWRPARVATPRPARAAPASSPRSRP